MVDWVQSILKIGSSAFAPKNKCVLDNIMFKLHYKVTTSMLLCCVMLLTGSLWFGKPISCIVNYPSVSKEAFETHCLMTGASTIYRTDDNPFKDNEPMLPYRGILPSTALKDGKYEERRHPWYKWTAPILMFGAMIFYFPRLTWKYFEGGRLNALRQDMGGRILLSAEERDQQRKLAVECLLESRGKSNRLYCWTFFFLEGLNVIICGVIIYLLNAIFDNQFVDYGVHNIYLLFLKQHVPRYDPMDQMFPKVAKCAMGIFGPSGSIVTVDGMCFLYHNFLNEVIFVFIWFWLIGLALLTLFYLAFFRTCCVSIRIRSSLLHNMCPAVKSADINIITKELGFCDWFLLKNLLSEIAPSMAHAIITDLAVEVRKRTRSVV